MDCLFFFIRQLNRDLGKYNGWIKNRNLDIPAGVIGELSVDVLIRFFIHCNKFIIVMHCIQNELKLPTTH